MVGGTDIIGSGSASDPEQRAEDLGGVASVTPPALSDDDGFEIDRLFLTLVEDWNYPNTAPAYSKELTVARSSEGQPPAGTSASGEAALHCLARMAGKGDFPNPEQHAGGDCPESLAAPASDAPFHSSEIRRD